MLRIVPKNKRGWMTLHDILITLLPGWINFTIIPLYTIEISKLLPRAFWVDVGSAFWSEVQSPVDQKSRSMLLGPNWWVSRWNICDRWRWSVCIYEKKNFQPQAIDRKRAPQIISKKALTQKASRSKIVNTDMKVLSSLCCCHALMFSIPMYPVADICNTSRMVYRGTVYSGMLAVYWTDISHILYKM